MSDLEKEIGRILYDINLLQDYPITDMRIVAMAQTIVRLKPSMTASWLRKIMDKFLIGELEWESHRGIRNIFDGALKTLK